MFGTDKQPSKFMNVSSLVGVIFGLTRTVSG